ncbi:MAG: AmmeMemoRadiSam system protein B [bacterium]|nr:AmmeMemoRadiSam system protein B [bacterium]
MRRSIKYFIFFAVTISIGFVAFSIQQPRGEAEISAIENFHASMYFYDNSDFFTQSVGSFANTKPLSPAPRIFIVNQHILAAHVIARQFALSADPGVTTVILITQNNWNAGHAPIITSRYGWKTPLGTIHASSTLADSLIQRNLAYNEEDIFKNEHGITGIVPYVAHSFPNASVVPLVIRDDTPEAIVDALAGELSKLNMSQTVIVGTIDMSHYLPKHIADAHDRLTVQSIKEFDYETLPRLDIDTVPTLRTIMKVAESIGQKKFVQTDGINSADIVGNPDLMETTSYISGYFTGGSAEEIDSDVHLFFVGDIMLDRGVAKHARAYGVNSLFAKVERLFLGTNAVIGNLEGTITDNPSVSEKDPSLLRFTFNPMFAGLLGQSRFTVLSLANNHALDFGDYGYEQTIKNLDGASIIPFGSPQNSVNISTRISIREKTVCLVGYHDLFTPDPAPALLEIKSIRESCSYVVLFAHWGIEYSDAPSDRQITLAHKFIDAGADLIIGAHPHVVEPIEIYKNKAIFYSLGNFIFDQNFSFATEHGLTVHVERGSAKTRFTLVPISIDRAEVKIAEPSDRQKILSLLVDKNLSSDIASDIINAQEFTLWNNPNNQ